MKDAQRRLDRLLTGNPSLSVQEREDLLERIIVPRREPRVGRQMWLWASACAAVVAVVALLPVVLREREMVSDDFRARGGRAANQASFHVTCAGGAARPDSDHARCQPGDTLAFDLMPPSDGAYFAAAALRDDGLIVWYFPDDDGNCLRVHAAGV